MKLSERISKFVFQIRGMWTAAGMVYESQRNVLGMTIELAREVEQRIQIKKELAEYKKQMAEQIEIKDGLQSENKALKRENEYLYRYAEEGGMDTDKFFEFADSLADTLEGK